MYFPKINNPAKRLRLSFLFKSLVFLSFLLNNQVCCAQSQERQVLAYNIGLGALSSGIGSIINKPKSVNWKHALLRGIWQGSAGGAINYLGKRSIIWVTTKKTFFAGIPSKILHSAGNSIIENAAFYRPLFDSWNFDYGFMRLTYSHSAKSFKTRFLPEILYAIPSAAKHGRINLAASLSSGIFVFESKTLLPETGISYGRSLVFPSQDFFRLNRYQILAHELIHTYQYQDYLVLNSWLSKSASKVVKGKIFKIFDKYIYADLPYVYPFYLSQKNHSPQHYYKNFYEFEAQRFSTQLPVRR